jgi:hypothetical protein
MGRWSRGNADSLRPLAAELQREPLWRRVPTPGRVGRVARPGDDLSVLLARAFLGIADRFDHEADARRERASLLLWANFLRVIPDDGISLRELPRAARVSRRACRFWLGLERHGWLSVSADGPRSKLVELTASGTAVRDSCRDRIATAERDWCAVVGRDETAALREALEGVVGEIGLEYPHHPMIYGAADSRALGGNAVAEKAGPPRIPPHGTDWPPVLRVPSSDELPLHALLSQALMAFTVDYEERAQPPMAMAAVLAQATRVAETSSRGWLEHEGVIVPDRSGATSIQLTPLGDRIRSPYETTVQEVGELWRTRHGATEIDTLLRSLQAATGERSAACPADDAVLVGFVPGIGFAHVATQVASARVP